MKDQNAQKMLARVMNWDEAQVMAQIDNLQLMASQKYDSYQQFSPGKKFIESLALWLTQFDQEDRENAFSLVSKELIYISDQELSHLVETAYPDHIVQERLRIVAEETGFKPHEIGVIRNHQRFRELSLKTLYLGLSDGARTNQLRRASKNEISNEQIWQAYELGEVKARDMVGELASALDLPEDEAEKARFNLVWLIDDFSGSGNTYIRYDQKKQKYKGKITKIYERLNRGDLVDVSHYEVYLLLLVATRQAIDHIEYWSERFTSENRYKPLRLQVLSVIEPEYKVNGDQSYSELLDNDKYYDSRAHDKHTEIGGTTDVKRGFAGCSLPVVLSHNTPNNSIYLFWGPETFDVQGLFPRVTRHKEF